MLCISAAYAVMRCLSVRLSVTFVDHVKTNKHIFEFFSPSGNHTILVFPHQTGWRYSDGNPPNWGVECRCMGYSQKSRFWSNSWLSKIAGCEKCQKHLPTTKLCIWHSRPRTTGYRSIAGRANYEVTKTVTDDHVVYIAQSPNVCMWRPAAWTNTLKRTEKNLIVRSGISEAETTNNKRLRSTFCVEAIQTRSIARPLCDSRASCSLRYGDITIFKIAAVRHLGIVLPPYETTHEVFVADRCCLSNIMSIWCTDLKIWIFTHIWLEMPIQAPKIGVLGTFDP